MKKTTWIAALLLCLALAPDSLRPAASRADTVALGAQIDNTLYEDAGGLLSNGAGWHFFAGSTGSSVTHRGLLAFDVSTIPAGATVTAVTLTLNMSRASSPDAETVALHRVLAGWGEGASDAPFGEGAGAPSAVGDATWIHTFYNTSFWAAAGGDFAVAPSATQSVADSMMYSWSSAGMVADVQAWVDGTASNFGWMLRGNEVLPATSKRFDSRTNPDQSARPALEIEFTPPVPSVPALGGWGLAVLVTLLLGAGAVCAALGRRSRIPVE